jgi:Holliday junction resolvase RusA-like endonuclease
MRDAHFTIEGRLPSLNEYINAERRNRFAGAKLKKQYTEMVARAAKDVPHFSNPVGVSILWIEPNRRRDLDNIYFGKKFILDGLVLAGVIENDDQRHVISLSDSIAVDSDNPRIEVTICEW